MKARTLIITVGATVALVGGTVQPAGAKVASKCAVSAPKSAKKVLVVGNGTKAPYYVLANGAKAPLAVGYTGSTWRYPQSAGSKSCGKSKSEKPLLKKRATVVPAPAIVLPAVQPEPNPAAIGVCETAALPADASYDEVATLGGCATPVADAEVSTPAPQDEQTATDTAASIAVDQAATASATDDGNTSDS